MKKITKYYTLYDKVTKTARPLVPAENDDSILRDLKNLINENKLSFYDDMDLYLILEFIEEDGNFKVGYINKKIFSLSDFNKQKKTTKKE